MAFTVGRSAYEAALDLKKQLLEEAAHVLESPADTLELSGDSIRVGAKPECSVPLAKVCYARHKKHGGPLIGKSSLLLEPPPTEKTRHSDHPYPAFPAPSFCAHAVELAVDDETFWKEEAHEKAILYLCKVTEASAVLSDGTLDSPLPPGHTLPGARQSVMVPGPAP